MNIWKYCTIRDLNSALLECNLNTACANFLQEYDLDKDLAMAEEFMNIEFEMPEVAAILNYTSKLIESDIEGKVKIGKGKVDTSGYPNCCNHNHCLASWQQVMEIIYGLQWVNR